MRPAKAAGDTGGGFWVLAVTILGSAMPFIDYSALNVILPVLQKELRASVADVQWIVSAYILFLSSLILVGGALGDIYGRRRMFGVGVILFAAASVWCGMVSTARDLIIARAFQGVGGALLVPGSLSIINAYFKGEAQPRAIGIWSAFSAITTAVGPILGGYFAEELTWRLVFYINAPVALIVLVLLYLRVPESRDDSRERTADWPGALLVTLGLGGVTYGFIEYPERGAADPVIIASLLGGAAALVLFVFVESKSTDPMVPLSLFKSAAFTGANVLTLLLYAALGGIMFFLPFNLIHVQGYSPTETGLTFLPFIIVMFTLSLLSGRLVNRLGNKFLLVTGPAITAAGFLMFSLPGIGGTFWTTFFPAILVMSVGMSLTVAPLTSTVMAAAARELSGAASGVNNAVSRIAGLLAIAVMGIFILGTFNLELNDRFGNMSLAPELRAELDAQRNQLSAMPIPPAATPETKVALKTAIGESFLAGYRVVCYICSALALISAGTAFFMIPGRLEGDDEPATPDATPDMNADA